MNHPKRYTITAALPYTNGPVHIGHLAGVYVPADIYARYLRLKGYDVAFICGSDEHGVPITLKAKNEGITPQQLVDKYHKIIKKSFADFGISFDNYSRTSASIHHETAADFFKDLYNQDVFEEQISEQFYDEEEKQFLADRYLTGNCPNCGVEDIYRDQCENCGITIQSPKDLLNIRSTITGNTPILKETKHWYLPFDETFLSNWVLKEHQHDWKSNVLGQVKAWIDAGLRPRAVTRDLDWGIKVPVKGAEGKVLYVWFDAPIGYISATKEWAEKKGKDWKLYWQNNESELIHFIGKDNIVFHCLIFPQMLKSHSKNYLLPTNVPANEFLNLENDKISTSKNWAVWLHEYLEEFKDQQDVLRYTLTANMPETKDNNFTWKDFQTKNNSELVNTLGNFINRILVLTNKYYKGVVPQSDTFTEYDREILKMIKEYPQRIGKNIEDFHFRDALADFMDLAHLGNKYLADSEPWKVIKTDENRTKTIMYIGLQVATALAQLAEPFLPYSSVKLKNFLNIDSISWNQVAEMELLPAGHKINPSELLFNRIEDETIEIQIKKLEENKTKKNMTNPEAKPQKDVCSFEDFQKIDLRVGTILEAKKVEKTDRLLELKVDTGIDIRTIVSGIAESFSPEELKNKQVMVLVNLASRKIKGITSQGMLLLTEKEDGKLTFVTPDDTIKNGEMIG
ncbi:MAG: methionine--tRNA ligase [Flavobacteriales bacterium]